MNVVKFFSGIESADLSKYSKGIDEKLRKVLELEKNDSSGSLITFTDNLELNHWKNILTQRNYFLLINYNAAMFYYEKGIYDDDFLNNAKKVNWENHFNYRYFVDNFFLSASSALDNIGYLLKVFYDVEVKNVKDISFKNMINRLNTDIENGKLDDNKFKDTKHLLAKLKDIKTNDHRYGDFDLMRNNIAHNNPPLTLEKVVDRKDGMVLVGTGTYQDSERVKKIIEDFLEVYVEIVDILFNISKKFDI
ncbi:Cthe_2314 family HEPN domain-containing protein [Staphylococcus equorum]|uniref:Cthe_2314 family HEPN domain-containing protein n=1 Tax=Staphylococcus equorum TaxID=246432 RepID=UPI000853485E|nr:Cthe_2314 family HEPN domain-containing protein [Staphylococcus equorum]OEK52274.1 hypothetical protein ASS97_12795 [Staphylococcus equorum]